MGSTGELLYTILRWSIVVITAIDALFVTINLIQFLLSDHKISVQLVVLTVLTILLLVVACLGAYKESFNYLIIGGVGLLILLIFGSIISYSGYGLGIYVLLMIMLFGFAWLVRRGGGSMSTSAA